MKYLLISFFTVILYSHALFTQIISPPPPNPLPNIGPFYYNKDNSSGSNSWPLNKTSTTSGSNQCQWIYGPNLFASGGTGVGIPAPVGQISSIFFRLGNTINLNAVYSDFTVSLGQNMGTQTLFSNGNFITGLTTCFYQSSFASTYALANQWFEVPLQTPFLYDPSLSLVLDIRVSAGSGNTVSLTYSSVGERIFAVYGSTSGTVNSGLVDFGFQFIQPTTINDAGVKTFIGPASQCDGVVKPVVVEIENYGTNQITDVEVHWTVNNVIQPTYFHTGLLDTAMGIGPKSSQVTLGSLPFVGGNSYNIKAWTEKPNGLSDSTHLNDTSDITAQGYNYPSVDLGLDTTTCPNDLVLLDAGSGHDSIIWDHGATTQFLLADTARTYKVNVWKNGCSGGDTINLNFFPFPPALNLGNDTMICDGDSILLDATTSGVTYLWNDNSTGPTHIANAVGTYSVTIEDVNTCKNTDAIHITQFSLPIISVSVVPRNSICFGAPFEFRANSFTQGSTMYQWKINAVNFGGVTSNNKFSPTLVYGDSVNVDLLTDVCSSKTYAISSNYIKMFLNPKPQPINGKSATDTVLENTSKNYLVPIKQGSTYTWSAVGGTIASPLGNGVAVEWGPAMTNAKIMVEEKDAGNCSYTNVRNVVIISVVGVNDEDNLIGMGFAYPNPANTTITIPLVIEGSWNIDLSLYDMTGRKVKDIYEGVVSGNRDFTIAVDDLRNGMYLYKVSTSDGYESVKKINIFH